MAGKPVTHLPATNFDCCSLSGQIVCAQGCGGLLHRPSIPDGTLCTLSPLRLAPPTSFLLLTQGTFPCRPSGCACRASPGAAHGMRRTHKNACSRRPRIPGRPSACLPHTHRSAAPHHPPCRLAHGSRTPSGFPSCCSASCISWSAAASLCASMCPSFQGPTTVPAWARYVQRVVPPSSRNALSISPSGPSHDPKHHRIGQAYKATPRRLLWTASLASSPRHRCSGYVCIAAHAVPLAWTQAFPPCVILCHS